MITKYKYDWLVVGAGLFGATFANLMSKAGKKVLVIDKRNHIAGNCHIQNRDNIPLHIYGPHIFHTSNDKVWEYVNQFASFNNFINMPKALYIDEKNNEERMFSLPFNMNTYHELFGCHDVNKAKDIIATEISKCNITSIDNLEQQALSLVGPTIYKYLVKYYTERQWGRKCDELSPDIIKRLPLRYSWNNNYFNDKYQGITDYTILVKKMIEGCEVVLSEDYFKHKEENDNLAEHVLYTGPIDKYFNYQYGPLQWRSVYWKFYSTDPWNTQGVAVINNVGPDGDYTRTIEHKFFNMMDENNVITKNWFSKEYSTEWKVDCPYDPAYPVHNKVSDWVYNEYKTLASADKKVIFGGRLASFSYMDMDDTIEAAMKLFDEVNGN